MTSLRQVDTIQLWTEAKILERQPFAPGTGICTTVAPPASFYATIRSPMQLRHLSLVNFRNFTRLETPFSPGITLLMGDNAQGKTSLLEAIYYLTNASSPHASNERQLINMLAMQEEAPFAKLSAEIQRDDDLRRIEIRLIVENVDEDRRMRKEVLINGVQHRVGDLPGEFNAVLFLPQDMQVLEGSPSLRRRYLDEAISQADPRYSQILRRYSRVLAQRNALLKRLQENNGPSDQLNFWDQKLSELAADLMRSRALALHELGVHAAEIHSRLTRAQETLRLRYTPAFHPQDRPGGQLGLPMEASFDWVGMSREALRQGLINAYLGSRGREIGRGVTLTGPHRDDFTFLSNGIDLNTYGSRGQNRTAMLALKLSQVDWLREKTGHWPVLLLDEVLAELDVQRRNDLLARVAEAQQALLTTTDLEMISPHFRQDIPIWHIQAGTITTA
jgi:DNA replication and repair protein RecF